MRWRPSFSMHCTVRFECKLFFCQRTKKEKTNTKMAAPDCPFVKDAKLLCAPSLLNGPYFWYAVIGLIIVGFFILWLLVWIFWPRPAAAALVASPVCNPVCSGQSIVIQYPLVPATIGIQRGWTHVTIIGGGTGLVLSLDPSNPPTQTIVITNQSTGLVTITSTTAPIQSLANPLHQTKTVTLHPSSGVQWVAAYSP